MIVSRHTHLDAVELQQYLHTLQQNYRRPTRRQPETAMRVAHGFGSVLVKRNWKQRIRAIPVLGDLMVRIYRGGFLQFDIPIPLREKIRSLPLLGKLATLIYAVIKLPSLRKAHAEDRHRIEGLEHNLRMLADDLEEFKESLSTKDDYNLSGDGFDAGRFYSEFSHRFRGSDADLETSQMPYVPIVQERLASPGSRESPVVVDMGCGNGVWMRLLAKNGISSIGFDLNAIAVQKARVEGLDARFADGIEWLETQPAESIDIITAFQLIEHLPPGRLLAFFSLAYRALRHGGLLICETPNPENLLVGACNFYMDFTHRHPIPHTLAQFIAEYTGFPHVRIQGMNTVPAETKLPVDSLVADKFNQFFYGPQDYAVIAQK
jgi:SAM-dependent methyltransferase